MNNVKFKVLSGRGRPSIEPGVFTLIPDNWNDYNFRTLFNLHYATEGQVIEIGMIKVGVHGMEEGDPHTTLPVNFTKLSEKFFSLGQSRDYYEKLRNLPGGAGSTALIALRDLAADPKIYSMAEDEPSFIHSLLRDIPEGTVKSQFRRIINGGVPLTPYSFTYEQIGDDANEIGPNLKLDFEVTPDSTPPTNVHVIIGANGVGKSSLLRSFVESAGGSLHRGKFTDRTISVFSDQTVMPFVNVVAVSYSAFDHGFVPTDLLTEKMIHRVGLGGIQGIYDLTDQFIQSVSNIKKLRGNRWKAAIRSLSESDPILAETPLISLIGGDQSVAVSQRYARELFDGMSSGHKIAVLTITRLVELVEEKSLVILDEPETHLHPPLLSALMRSISDLVIDRNGVAIIATHSPVVLQEVPSSCVWMLRRSGSDVQASRLTAESFGESVSRLTAEVFHLDIRKSGYHKILRELMKTHEGSVSSVLSGLDNQVGSEGLFSLYSFERKKSDDV